MQKKQVKRNGCIDLPILGISVLIMLIVIVFMGGSSGNNQAASEQQQAQPVVNETVAATIRTEMESTVVSGEERERAIIEDNPATIEILKKTPEAATQVAVMQPTREYLREELGVEHAEGATVEEIQTLTGDLVYPTDTPSDDNMIAWTSTPDTNVTVVLPTQKAFEDLPPQRQLTIQTAVAQMKPYLKENVRGEVSPGYYSFLEPTIDALSPKDMPVIDYYSPFPDGFKMCWQAYPLNIPISFSKVVSRYNHLGLSEAVMWGESVSVSTNASEWYTLDTKPSGVGMPIEIEKLNEVWFFKDTSASSRLYLCVR